MALFSNYHFYIINVYKKNGNKWKKSQSFNLFFTPKLKWDKETAEIWLSLFHFFLKKTSTDFQSKMNYYITKRAGVLFWNIPDYIQLYHATNFIFNNLWITIDHAEIDL